MNDNISLLTFVEHSELIYDYVELPLVCSFEGDQEHHLPGCYMFSSLCSVLHSYEGM